MTVTQVQIDASAERVKQAASQGYATYSAATSEHKALLAAFNAQQPERRIVVVGDTYRQRNALRKMGLRWDDVARAWVGMVRGAVTLPHGCREAKWEAAALATMDHTDSAL